MNKHAPAVTQFCVEDAGKIPNSSLETAVTQAATLLKKSFETFYGSIDSLFPNHSQQSPACDGVAKEF